MIGQRFGRLVVIDHGRITRTGHATYRCRCDCGATSDVWPHHLKSGATKSCGCLRAESMRRTSEKWNASPARKAWDETRRTK